MTNLLQQVDERLDDALRGLTIKTGNGTEGEIIFQGTVTEVIERYGLVLTALVDCVRLIAVEVERVSGHS